MTRVNLVDPSILTDQHLVAERLELSFVVSSAIRSFNSKSGLKVNPVFVLGAGHVSFFHDKLSYIKDRHRELTNEMIRRGMKPKYPLQKIDYVEEVLPQLMVNKYKPSDRDINIVKVRIIDRISMKPSWYKYFGQSIGDGQQFINLYK